jgi:hypothetical protein
VVSIVSCAENAIRARRNARILVLGTAVGGC